MISIDNLKKRLDGNGQLLVQHERGDLFLTRFEFEMGASHEEIQSCEQAIGCTLPEDYHKFLTIYNGAELFIEVTYNLSSLQINSTEKLVEYVREYQNKQNNLHTAYPSHWLLFASYHGFGEYLFLDMKNANTIIVLGDGWKRTLDLSFSQFLERIIITNGAAFWHWGNILE